MCIRNLSGKAMDKNVLNRIKCSMWLSIVLYLKFYFDAKFRYLTKVLNAGLDKPLLSEQFHSKHLV